MKLSQFNTQSSSPNRWPCLCILLVAVIACATCAGALRIRHPLFEATQGPTPSSEQNIGISPRQSQPETPKIESLFTFQSYEIVVDPVAGVPRVELSLDEQVARIPILATFNLMNPFNNTDLRIEALVLSGNVPSSASGMGSDEPAELIPFAYGAAAGDLAADIPAYPKIDALTSRNVTLPLQITLPFHKDSRLLRVLRDSCGTDRVNVAEQKGSNGAGLAPAPSIRTVWKGQVKITAMQRLLFGLYLPIIQDVEIKDVSFDMPCPAVLAPWQAGKAGCA